MKPILISGVQPTGKLHLGNYLGALKNFVELQNSGDYQYFFFVADLHSLTEDFDTKQKSAEIKEVVMDYLAAGIDPKKSVIFIQSSIPQHSELAVILNNFTPLGELKRMTQFKNKSENMPGNINAGLFDYPVLMASDILLYDAKFVPVGDDQVQHIEFTRTIARKFNNKFGKTFIEPEPLLTENSRVMSLDQPDKKMSKSRPAGCLFLDDPPEVIRKKVMSATTDSGNEIKADMEGKEGIGNLILLYSTLSGEKNIAAIEKHYKGKGYGAFKKDLAEIAVKTLAPFREAKKKIAEAIIKSTIEKGNKIAGEIAKKKIAEVKEKIGLL